MASGILGVALSGLNAAQAGIRTTQHNIANVNTPGYRRQEVGYAAQQPDLRTGMYYGSGVSVESVRSLYSRFLDNEVALNASQLARHQTYASHAGQIDRLLGDANTGLSTALDGFFAAVNEVANDPVANAPRQALLSAAATLSHRVNTLDDRLRAQLAGINDELVNTVDQINTLAGRIAASNADIVRAEALSGRTANDLRDQRDQLIAELGQWVDVTRIEQDGDVSVFIGSGQPLVLGMVANALATTLDADGLRQLELNVGGTLVSIGSGLIGGGRLGGVLAVREQVVLPAFHDLNRIAVAIGAEVNRVHRAGLQADGVTPGGDFFTGVVDQTGGSTGWIRLEFSANALPSRDYAVTFNGADYTVTRLLDGASVNVAAGAEVVMAGVAQGFRIQAGTPAPAAGETWNLNFQDYARNMRALLINTSAVAAAADAPPTGPGDNRNALALAALQQRRMLDDGGSGFSGAYNRIVARTAALAAQADAGQSALLTLVTAATEARQAVSGVNLDEEAVNLIRFQQAYQASARAMQIASRLFDEVLGIVR